MQKPSPSPLARLSKLVNGGEPLSEEEVVKMDERDEETVKVIDKVLEFVSKQPGCDDVFVMQELVEACADELRGQIREMVEGDDE